MEATKIIGGALDMFGSILLKSMDCFQKWKNNNNTSLDNQESNKNFPERSNTFYQNLNKAFFRYTMIYIDILKSCKIELWTHLGVPLQQRWSFAPSQGCRRRETARTDMYGAQHSSGHSFVDRSGHRFPIS
jgi:hypothetical protein